MAYQLVDGKNTGGGPGGRANRKVLTGIFQPRADFWGTGSVIAGWRCTQYDGIVALAACEYFERGCRG
jgi:hypothetical protein